MKQAMSCTKQENAHRSKIAGERKNIHDALPFGATSQQASTSQHSSKIQFVCSVVPTLQKDEDLHPWSMCTMENPLNLINSIKTWEDYLPTMEVSNDHGIWKLRIGSEAGHNLKQRKCGRTHGVEKRANPRTDRTALCGAAVRRGARKTPRARLAHQSCSQTGAPLPPPSSSIAPNSPGKSRASLSRPSLCSIPPQSAS